ncbi:four helix bundle protein [Luteitalea pratensis]|uniref:Four helix bundle protein n=1 Tax=Luteitalea pratensis TaxID=1855912 RepID=A0A143PSZ5_LUTPR|nr:four helix bundle protein [Luteitalea pratensis]
MARDIQERAFRLALRVTGLEHDDGYRAIVRRIVVAQLVRSVTSIGSNLEEATGAQSKADFIAWSASRARKHAKRNSGSGCRGSPASYRRTCGQSY